MKNKIVAFTLIEILVSITIISIVSITTLNWFLNFLEENTIKLKTSNIINNIENLDKKIQNKEIFDYEIVFDKNFTNSWYIIYENIAWEETRQEVVDIDNSNDIKIWIKWSSGNNWYANVYKEHKISIAKNVINTEYSFDLENWYDYNIYWTLSWTTNKILNNIRVKQIDKEENEIIISKITKTLSWSNINNISLQNINWNKQITNSWNIIPNAFIYFDKNWVQSFIEITK